MGDQSVECWGQNTFNQLAVPSGLSSVIGIEAGIAHTCAVLDNKSVECWGVNGHGQTDVPENLGLVQDVSGGRQHTCVLLEDQSVECWGSNIHGEIDVPANLQSGAAGTVEWTRQLGTATSEGGGIYNHG